MFKGNNEEMFILTAMIACIRNGEAPQQAQLPLPSVLLHCFNLCACPQFSSLMCKI